MVENWAWLYVTSPISIAQYVSKVKNGEKKRSCAAETVILVILACLALKVRHAGGKAKESDIYEIC